MDNKKQDNEKNVDDKLIKFDLMFPDKYQVFGIKMREPEIIRLRESKISEMEELGNNIESKYSEEEYDEYEYYLELGNEKKSLESKKKSDNKKKGKEIKKRKLIKYFFDDVIKTDYVFKKYFYDQYKNIKEGSLLSISQIQKKYIENTNNYKVKCIYQSDLMSAFNYNVKSEQLFTDKIVYNPRVCLFLANRELFPIFNTLDDMPKKISSFIRKAYEADKNNFSHIICSYEEAEKFWNAIFNEDYVYTFWLLKRVKKTEKKDIINYIKNKEEEQSKIDMVQNEEQSNDKNSVVEFEGCKKVKLKLKVANYLSFFIYAMIKLKKNNPIVMTEPFEYTNSCIKKIICGSSFLNDEQKEMVKICYQNIAYKQKIDNRFINVESYNKFVVAYLKLCGEKLFNESEILTNIYLFESFFGFAFIESVIDKIQEELLWNNVKLNSIFRYKYFEEIKKIFEEGDVLTRIDFAKYFIEMVFSGRYKKNIEIWNFILDYTQEKDNVTSEKKIENFNLKKIPQLMPYWKIIKNSNPTDILSVLLRKIDVKNLEYGESEERKEIKQWLLGIIDIAYWQPRFYDSSYQLTGMHGIKCN